MTERTLICLVALALAALAAGCRPVGALGAQTGPDIAQAQIPGLGELPVLAAEADQAEKHETTELLGSRALFNAVHALGIIGGIGLVAAAALGFVIRWSTLSPHRRRRLASLHVVLGVPFGVLAMTHGTVLFFHELLEGDWGFGGALGPGSWLCTFTFLMVVSGLGRRYDRRRARAWVSVHNIVIWLWLVAAAWHLLAELL